MSHQTSSKVSKVFLDTCVLVSASVYGSYIDLDIKLEHQFYTKTVRLFELIRKHVEKRIGIITFTIEKQATAVIASAVATALEEKTEKLEDMKSKADLFESHSIFFDQCLSHLQENLSILQRTPVEDVEKTRCYADITIMYNNLQKIADKLDINKIINANVARRYQRAIRHEILEQTKKRYKQLLKLKNEPVEQSDKRILCEAITLLKNYQATNPNTKMYLASTDYHFSPSDSGGEIAKQIRKQFKIICDWPDKISLNLNSDGYS